MAFKNTLLSIILLISFQSVLAQESTIQKMAFSISGHRGFLVAHRPSIVPLQQKKVNGLEVNLILKTDGSQNWQKTYDYPNIGLSIAYWDLGNKNQLGYGISVVPSIDFPVSKGRNHSFNLKFGWGIGYIDKIFDAHDNYKNIAIGSHLNCALLLQPSYRLSISKKTSLSVGLSITHFSNGSIATPNLGINLASFSGGLLYNIGKYTELKNPELPVFHKSTRFTIFGSGSMKQVYPADGKNYFASTVSGNLTRQKSRKSGIGGGVDVFYDQSIHQKVEAQNMKLNNSFETLRAGIHGSYELVMSDLSLMVSMGGYLYSKLHSDGLFYHRIAVRYRVSNKVFTCINLKAHWGKADFIEWGIGYRIDYNEKNIN